MLFNSWVFIAFFLPVVLTGYSVLIARKRVRAAYVFLTIASFVFYGAWDIRFLPLLLVSILVNFLIGEAMARRLGRARLAMLVAGLVFNLGLLFFFKYALFTQSVFKTSFGVGFGLSGIVLPIGISFYTFQSIGYLVDVYRGTTVRRDLVDFALFISFFPQLIAGPIVHHAEMMPQFSRPRTNPLTHGLAVGITIFVFGLAKKVILADSLALVATPVFDLAAHGHRPDLLSAWVGLLAYALQIYFDFSGYSDMAVGLGAMFGIRLPVNFASPYRAISIIDFWRRWHITLSRFLRDYLYFPLGGNRRGKARRYVNIFVTMVLGGIWHGAGWTFLLWGAFHGVLIVINHAWQRLWHGPPLPRFAGWGLTFVLVTLAWVPFRALDIAATWHFYGGLFGMGGLPHGLDPAGLLKFGKRILIFAAGLGSDGWINPVAATFILPLALTIALALPNVIAIMGPTYPGLRSPGYPDPALGGIHHSLDALHWRPDRVWSIVVAILAAVCLLKLNDVSEFIYFQF